MSFSNEIYNLAKETVAERRSKALAEAQTRRNAFILRHPEYADMQQALSHTGYELAFTIFRDGNGSKDISAIRDRNLELQRKMASLLEGDGLPTDHLEPKFFCTACEDTGICGGKLCECMDKVMRQIAYDRLNSITPLGLCTFDSFTMQHYSTQENANGVSQRRMMQITLNKCRSYAERFTLESPSLLFHGGVGLGKTHLSLAIAGEVIGKGYDVVYGSAHSLFSKIERERFGRGATPQDDTLSLLNSCDLLIIDDLGAEFVTQLSVSILYDIVNTRLLRGRPTIISTNLNSSGLEQKYTDRIVSRLSGGYTWVPFEGNDMRITLRKARRNQGE